MRDWVLLVFFSGLVLLGYALFKDYGISWDEPQQRLIGQVSTTHVMQTLLPFLSQPWPETPSLHEFRDKDYGVLFELPAAVLELALGMEDSRNIFMMRHLLTFLVFLIGLFALYQWVARRFGDWRWGLLAAVVLLLSPRFFAEAFYNSKDIVFMAMFTLALSSMMAFLLHPGLRTGIWHGVATGLAMDVRIMAVLIPVATVAVLLLKVFKGELAIRRMLSLALLYGLVSAAVVVAFFPFLWADPLGNLARTFLNMSQFGRWGGAVGGDVLYFGQHINGHELPWHYAPAWIGITTPLLYLGFFLLGAGVILAQFGRANIRLWRTPDEMQDLIALGFVVVPILAVISLQSVLYNGWRQLYFLYPAILFVAIRGFVWLWARLEAARWARAAVLAVSVAMLGHTVHWMWQAHPLHNVYFNALAGQDLRLRFELDYWGLANRQALEWILEQDGAERVVVAPRSFTPLELSLLILRPLERERIEVVRTPSGPHYLINNYYGWARDGDLSKIDSRYDLAHEITVAGEVVLSIYRSDGS